MIKLNGKPVEQNHFPDGTLLLKEEGNWLGNGAHEIEWRFERNEELVTLIFLTKHLKSYDNTRKIKLFLPYIPNARMDRVKTSEDVFTLKYFCEVINSLNFTEVRVLDPHSNVALALLDRVVNCDIKHFINEAIISSGAQIVFYPDEGAMKRYSEEINMPYAFGIKKRDWETGRILGLDITNEYFVKGKDILIVDDICSRGGTFYHSAKALKEAGANKIYLYVTHCENTILEGEVLTSGLIEKVYTTGSIFTKEHEKVEVMYK